MKYTTDDIMQLADELVAAAARESITSCKGGFETAKARLRVAVSEVVDRSPVPVSHPLVDVSLSRRH